VRYSEAVLAAPPGAASFRPGDVARLAPATLRQVLAPGPSSPPLEDVAAALAGRPSDLYLVAGALPPARGERLLRLSQRPVGPGESASAAERLVRGLFWSLVYELEPGRWAELADLETVHPDLVAALPVDGRRVLEVGAGSGRLTLPIAARAGRLVATEPSGPLRRTLAGRLGDRGWVVAALTQALPLAGGSFEVVLCCAAISPDPPLGGQTALAELERVTAPGGSIVLVGPEAPEWFVEHGFERRDFPAPPSPAPAEVVAFFGRLDPPHTLLVRRR
jgi:SAM-dependent methyltransferase